MKVFKIEISLKSGRVITVPEAKFNLKWVREKLKKCIKHKDVLEINCTNGDWFFNWDDISHICYSFDVVVDLVVK